MNIELRGLAIDDGLDVYSMLQDMPADENGFVNKVHGMTYDEYRQWLVGAHQASLQQGIVDGWKVPSTIYWLYVDGTPVGFGKLRHFLTDALRVAGGNIGYGIAPKYRGRGYGKRLLALLLQKASELGIEKALVTVHAGNLASRAVALANGGVEQGEVNGRVLYWIDTPPLK